MKTKTLHIILLIIMSVGFARAQEQTITGKVMSGSYLLEGVLVVNLRAERDTKTDSRGVFHLIAKEGDTLIVTDAGIKTVQVVIDADFIEGGLINVEMKNTYELDELIVEKDNSLTSEALGLVKKGQKRYTPAERKLYTAGDFKPIHLLAIIGGGMPFDPVLNAINGRTKMIKRTIAVEHKEFAMEELNSMFTAEEITQGFNIPEAYINGFLFYCVEDEEFTSAIKSKNQTLAKFLMTGLANNYLEIITEDSNKPIDTDE